MTLHQVAPVAQQLFHPKVGRVWRGFLSQAQASQYDYGWTNHIDVLSSGELDVHGPEFMGAFDRESHEDVQREHAEAMDDMADWASAHADECGRRL